MKEFMNKYRGFFLAIAGILVLFGAEQLGIISYKESLNMTQELL